MKDPRKFLLVSVIVVLALMFVVTFIRDPRINKFIKTTEKSAISPTVRLTIAQNLDDYSDWTLFRNGYAFPLPSDWRNTSDTGGRAVLEPGESPESRLGSIQEISTTVLSDKKAAGTGQRFTTELEFTEWSAVSGEVQGDIQKLDNILVDGEKGIMFFDTSGEEGEWKVIVWVRKDGNNFYLSFVGDSKYNEVDVKAIDYIVSHFTFTAPPSTGKEDK